LFCYAVLAPTWFDREPNGSCVAPCCSLDTVVHWVGI